MEILIEKVEPVTIEVDMVGETITLYEGAE